MRGRKPHPTAVKLLRGNPGRRPVNEHEPKHAAIDPTSPDELLTDDLARQEWDRIATVLADRGQVTVVDRQVLIAYCMKFSQWRRLEAEAALQPFVITSPSGHATPNPIHRIADRVFGLMLKAATELGLTPSSRSRVIAQPTAATSKDDPFVVHQRARTDLTRVK